MLDNVISIVLPSINPDGTQMIADWYMKYVGTEHEAAPACHGCTRSTPVTTTTATASP